MPQDRATAIPNLEAIKRALSLRRKYVGSRDRVSVREAGWQHLDAGNVLIAQEIAQHDPLSEILGRERNSP
jgi:hypothetical protein